MLSNDTRNAVKHTQYGQLQADMDFCRLSVFFSSVKNPQQLNKLIKSVVSTSILDILAFAKASELNLKDNLVFARCYYNTETIQPCEFLKGILKCILKRSVNGGANCLVV